MQIEPPPFDVPQPPWDVSPIVDVPTLDALRAYRGPSVAAIVIGSATPGDGFGVVYVVKPGDKTTADDGVRVIVDPLGRRWWRGSNSETYREITESGVVVGTSSDDVIGIKKSVGSPTTVNVPANSVVGKCLAVVDAKGDADTNNITVVGAINGGTSYVISTAYGYVRLMAVGPNAWRIFG